MIALSDTLIRAVVLRNNAKSKSRSVTLHSHIRFVEAKVTANSALQTFPTIFPGQIGTASLGK